MVPYPPFGEQISPSDNTRPDIVRIDPTTGSEQVESTIKPIPTLHAEEGPLRGQATYFDGHLFLVQPPFREDG